MLGAASAGDEFLHSHVKSYDNVLPGLSRNAGEFAHDLAKCVDLDLAGACRASQLGILRLFDAALADAKIGQLESGLPFELVLRNSGDIAHNVRRGVAERIMTGRALLDRNARQLGYGDFDPGHFVPTAGWRGPPQARRHACAGGPARHAGGQPR